MSHYSLFTTYHSLVTALLLSNLSPIAAAVYGLEISPISSDGDLLERALNVEVMIRGMRGSRGIPELASRALPNQLPYARLASTLHTGDLLLLWDSDPERSSSARAALASVIRLDDLGGTAHTAAPVVFVIWSDPAKLAQAIVGHSRP